MSTQPPFAPFVLGGRSAQRVVRRTHGGPAGGREERLARRVREREDGRACASILLAALGSRDTAVGVAPDRAPVWPDGFVGSIAHTDAWLCVAAARRSDVLGVGIDAEAVLADAEAGAVEEVCLGPDEVALHGATGLTRGAFATVCFSAKEALYKCLFPLVRRVFDFRDVRIESIDAARGALVVALVRALPGGLAAGACFRGDWTVAAGHVFSSFELAPSGQPPW
jgi:enterobactin synthetase component D / holo-[acyl-carrier protein] synthase